MNKKIPMFSNKEYLKEKLHQEKEQREVDISNALEDIEILGNVLLANQAINKDDLSILLAWVKKHKEENNA